MGKCLKHPNYNGKTRPTNGCDTCIQYYLEVQGISSKSSSVSKKSKRTKKSSSKKRKVTEEKVNKKTSRKRKKSKIKDTSVKEKSYKITKTTHMPEYEEYQLHKNDIKYWNKKSSYGYTRAMWAILYMPLLPQSLENVIDEFIDIFHLLDWDTEINGKNIGHWILKLPVSYIEKLLKKENIRILIKSNLHKDPLEGLSVYDFLIRASHQPTFLGRLYLPFIYKYKQILKLFIKYNIIEDKSNINI